ncbi:hypothetical protein HF086_009269 [Spodoptera exigua]|uniref:Uncharacterized protein n=1 Tax=Spodoptera exigua TaxID=7107 RepID=A0A922MCY2_SPOEX|nr:hypothetical protein HF086_009269 [Spodoptera exigua]
MKTERAVGRARLGRGRGHGRGRGDGRIRGRGRGVARTVARGRAVAGLGAGVGGPGLGVEDLDPTIHDRVLGRDLTVVPAPDLVAVAPNRPPDTTNTTDLTPEKLCRPTRLKHGVPAAGRKRKMIQ